MGMQELLMVEVQFVALFQLVQDDAGLLFFGWIHCRIKGLGALFSSSHVSLDIV